MLLYHYPNPVNSVWTHVDKRDGLNAGTSGWPIDGSECATQDNDPYGFSEIRGFLAQAKNI
jgi:hypothetical protein